MRTRLIKGAPAIIIVSIWVAAVVANKGIGLAPLGSDEPRGIIRRTCSMTGKAHELRVRVLLASLAGAWLPAVPAFVGLPSVFAQPDEGPRHVQRFNAGYLRADDLPILIDTSPPIANLFMRADEGIMRRDWKLAIDSLQRIMDDRTGTLVLRDETLGDEVVYESSQRRALEILSTLPPDGILAYRVLYDGKAKGLFERAKAAGDAEAVRAVADRYLLTRSGDDAADWAASDAFNQGRFAEAAARLNDILRYVPNHDIPPERIYSKLYAAYVFMGFPQEAANALEAYRQLVPASGGEDRSDRIVSELGEEWAERLHRRLAEVEQRGETLPRRRGGPLTPSLAGLVPWRFELTGTAADLWRRISDVQPGDPSAISRLELVGNGRQLFVRTPGGCIALDMEDLIPVWQTEGATRPRAAPVNDPRRGLLMPQLSRTPSGPYTDEPWNLLSLAHELVFTLDRQGMSDFLDRDEVRGGGIFFVRPGPRTLRRVEGTRLIAHESQSGEIRWSRGRTDSADDPLANVRFLAPPIAIRDQLWVPYMQGSDFFVGALRPADGALLRNVLVASIRDATPAREQVQPTDPVTPLTERDGVVYVPTGMGAIAAIDAATMRTRWTHIYDTRSGGRRRADRPSRWMAGAPVVESGVVVLTPTDSSEAVAIDAAKGSVRWRASLPECSYTIAADRGTIWFGGEQIVALNLTDGNVRWRSPAPGTPTGRAALCGDEIHVPTSTGLMSLNASNGEQTALHELPASQAPLGNIACVESSLYSIEPSSVRKFPDLARMHAISTEQLRANPRDIAALVRLAWAELLMGRARAAFDGVRNVPDAGLDTRQRMSLARVRTESLLTLAQAADSPEESLALLQEASTDDLTASLRLRFRTAIADQLAALGRYEEAYRALLALALTSDAAEVSPTEEGVRISSRLLLRSKIDGVRRRLEPRTAERLAEEARRRIDEVMRQTDGKAAANTELAALAEVYEGTNIAQFALLALADNLLKDREYEKAEQALAQCGRGQADPASALTAMIRLGRMYLESQQRSPGLMAFALKELEQRAGAWKSNSAASHSDLSETIERLRDALADPLNSLGLASVYAEPGSEPAALTLSGRVGWNYDAPLDGEPVRVVLFDGPLPPALTDRLLIAGREGFLECISAGKKELLWKSRLELPGRFDDNVEGVRSQSVQRFGVADGQTVVLNGPEGIFAIGAITGRLLWARPFDRALVDLAGSAARDRIMASGDGLVVAAPRDGYLSLLRMTDGSTVWERDLRGASLARVWMEGDAVVFSDADMKYAHILDRRDGRSIARIQLRQPNPEHERVTLVVSQGMVYGPDKSSGVEAVVGYSLSSGERVWRSEVEKPIVSLFEPRKGYLGVGLLGGDVKILDARNGGLVLERSDPTVRAINSGVMWAGTLILRATALRGPKQSIELVAFDIATGTEEWRRQDLAMLSTSEDRLEIVGGVIAGVIEKSKMEEGLRKGAGTRLTAYATLIDVRTGADAGTMVELIGYGHGSGVNGDLAVYPGLVAVGTMKGIQGIMIDFTPLPERGF